jgi:histidyl-tRNA synthetase
LKDYYRPLLNESRQDCRVRFYKNPLRLLDCKEPQDQPKIFAAPKIIDYLCEPCRETFCSSSAFSKCIRCALCYRSLIVRGLDYYTRTVFEFTSGIKSRRWLVVDATMDWLKYSVAHAPALALVQA